MALRCKFTSTQQQENSYYRNCLSVFIYIRLCGVLERKVTLELDWPGLKCLPRGSWMTLAGSFSRSRVGKITGWRRSAAQRATWQLLLHKRLLLFLFPKTRCDAERALWFFFCRMTGPGKFNFWWITDFSSRSRWNILTLSQLDRASPLVHWQIWEGNFSRSVISVCLPKHYSHVTVNFLYLLRHKDLLKW